MLTTANSVDSVYDDLALRFTTIFFEDFGRADAAECADRLVSMLKDEGPRSTNARAFLRESELREAWNDVFDHHRSTRLAAQLAPYVTGPRVVDILAGNGTLTKAVADLVDADVTAWEVPGSYDPPFAHPVKPLDELPEQAAKDGTVLISTVLHHEPDCVSLLDRCTRLGAARWLVVENCLHDHVSRRTHELIDDFFNGCLNEFDVPCSYEHRTVRGWIEILSRFGRLTYYTDLGRIPGLPFPYELFVIDR